jgi:uncharacterized peroxidase-related enzyme
VGRTSKVVEEPMSYLRRAPIDEEQFAPFADARRAFGFVPNFYRSQTLRPDLIEAETPFVGSLLIKEGALARAQKEYIFLVCSAANLSTYCVTAHCEIVRALGLKGPEPEKVATDHLHTDLPIADKVLLSFALKLNNEPTKYGRADVERLRTYGFTDEQILEAILMVGLAKWANLVSLGLGAEPDFEVPKGIPLPAVEKAAPPGDVQSRR